ncbi:MAG: TnsA endonuclease N-terminal domain-containing protein [Candidatus Thiodiazotropha taylori]|nr:TnsA endonuclease N-terminal domain-containing protein [Candidatus Thiodiazotropha taylori]MCW4225326.1 TnsA endonuclease N-terminal domain-containing protein [Candidatus Thiodiazotropha endolucinida]MCG7886896.1 TnsA endonuclease N-terminal domain-containing protein [Candidatus Thiodiazotropha taylori]MCG7890429.1 TnsA endonuclease N-terminal domain-containing protein [Candidatus Thiodiazotropha taylori]MCG7953363.1 TnsA endonuclease N-terminal domain-containing protein [Candidatus Thiodiaz
MRSSQLWMKRERTEMGVRRVPISSLSLTGQFDGQQFESSLERDLLLLAAFDLGVDWYESQPISIEYYDSNGRVHTYTPDLLIMYFTHGRFEGRKPMLCEVKYREDFFDQWKLLKPKLKAARKYARERGWEFRVLTEKEIRTPYLRNVKFLFQYRYNDFNEGHYRKLAGLLDEVGETTPKELLESAYSSKIVRGEALWTLWCMVARCWVRCDLSLPLTMNSRIWTRD